MFREAFIDEVRSNLSGGVKAENVIDRRGEFQAAFISVALNARDPLGIDNAAAVNTKCFFFQAADATRFRPRGVSKVSLGILAGQAANRRDHASVKLIVVVGIENIMLTVILIVKRDLDSFQAVREDGARIPSIGISPIGIASPFEKHLG